MVKEVSQQLQLNNTSLPKKFFTDQLTDLISVDGSNIEFRTMPSSVKQLTNSIIISDALLRLFMEKLAGCIPGGIGVFLPKTTRSENTSYSAPDLFGIINTEKYLEFSPTKHVNISFPDTSIYDPYFICKSKLKVRNFLTKVKFKTRQPFSPKRMHITVPYNFTDYVGLVAVAYPMYERVSTCPHTVIHGQPVTDVVDQFNMVVEYLDDWARNNPMPTPILLKYVRHEKIVNLKGLL